MAIRQSIGRNTPSQLEAVAQLLPTPSATDGAGGHTSRSGARKGEPLLVGIAQLLPTPVTSYSQRTPGQWRAGRPAGNGAVRERIADLGIVAEHLLPTPQATDRSGGPRALPETRTHRGTDHGPRLRDMAPALLPAPTSDVSGRTGEQHMGMRHSIECAAPSQLRAARDRGPAALVALENVRGHLTMASARSWGTWRTWATTPCGR
jgi:DNA (cytosine-5)-methyltransferase 1